MSVWLSFAQIFNTVPTNFLSYLAEWDSNTTDFVKKRSSEQTGTMSDTDALYYIPTKLLGFHWSLSHVNIYYAFIVYGCLDLFNFSIFLFYQFRSCTLLRLDFHKFLYGFKILRPFIKPVINGRNRLNSTSGRLPQRRASKI